MTLTIDIASYICEPKHIHGGIGNIRIGKFCSIAANCTFDAGFQHEYKNVTTFPMHILKEGVASNVRCNGDIVIGNDVWIGMNVMIMGGVTIGNGAVIGAGTVVRRNIDPYEIYTGSKTPEKYRFNILTQEILTKIAWWDWPEEKILANAARLVSGDIDGFIRENI
jgi:virginiamycin A acetyltransferase